MGYKYKHPDGEEAKVGRVTVQTADHRANKNLELDEHGVVDIRDLPEQDREGAGQQLFDAGYEAYHEDGDGDDGEDAQLGDGEEVDEAEADQSDDEDDAGAVEDLLSNSVGDVKDYVRQHSDDVDVAQLLEAERDGKDRSTLVDWLENRVEDNDEDEE